MFKLRPVTFHSPPLRSGDISISSAQIRRRGGGFAISLLSSSLRWRCGGGFCNGSFLVWIENLVFLWVCWIFVGFGLCFWSGFVVGWSVLLTGLWVLLVVGGWWSLALWVLYSEKEREREAISAKRKEQRTKKKIIITVLQTVWEKGPKWSLFKCGGLYRY